MNTQNLLISKRLAVLKSASGAVVVGAPRISGYLSVDDRKNFRRFLAVLMVCGAWDDSETLDFDVVCASDAQGTGMVSLKAATQRAADATDNDGIIIAINLREEEIKTSGKPYIALRCRSSDTAGGNVCMMLLAADDRYGPTSDYNDASVVEAVE